MKMSRSTAILLVALAGPLCWAQALDADRQRAIEAENAAGLCYRLKYGNVNNAWHASAKEVERRGTRCEDGQVRVEGAAPVSGLGRARDFQFVGRAEDSIVLVDHGQLKKTVGTKDGAERLGLKFIQHWDVERNLGFEYPVIGEEFLHFVECDAPNTAILFQHRFLASSEAVPSGKSTVLKAVNFNEKGGKRVMAPAGSALAMAIGYSCSWIRANR